MRQTSRAAYSALCLLTLALWLAASVAASPAPWPRREPRPAVPRRCVLVWRSARYDALFAPGGRYRAGAGAAVWVGSWRLEGRTLFVEERIEGASGPPLRWSATLDGRLREGELRGGGRVELSPR